jgi:hypothetical protein
MKKSSKLLSVILAIIIAFGCTTVAFASEPVCNVAVEGNNKFPAFYINGEAVYCAEAENRAPATGMEYMIIENNNDYRICDKLFIAEYIMDNKSVEYCQVIQQLLWGILNNYDGSYAVGKISDTSYDLYLEIKEVMDSVDESKFEVVYVLYATEELSNAGKPYQKLLDAVVTPVIEEPEVEEPVVEEPTTEEPTTEEPTTEEPTTEAPTEPPVVEEPTTEEPVIEEPTTEAPTEPPVVEEPTAEEPTTEEPTTEEPVIEEPEIVVPEITVPEITLPELPEVNVVLPEINLPQIEIPTVEVPDINIDINIDIPTQQAPEIEIPEVQEQEIPSIEEIPSLEEEVVIPEPEVQEPEIQEPETEEPDQVLSEQIPVVDVEIPNTDAGASIGLGKVVAALFFTGSGVVAFKNKKKKLNGLVDDNEEVDDE